MEWVWVTSQESSNHHAGWPATQHVLAFTALGSVASLPPMTRIRIANPGISQRYGLPLVGAATLLHWLISQSIFVVRLLLLKGEDVFEIETGPGFSPIAIIFAMICGLIIIFATIGLSSIPCKTAVPHVGTCPAVLSAACHPPEGDENAALKEVMWGVVSGRDSDAARDGEERCCITSWEVKPPIDGKAY